MEFKDAAQGHFRIYAGCMEHGAREGFLAAVVVCRASAGPEVPAVEIFRDVSLCAGHRWLTSEEALSFAVARGGEIADALAAQDSLPALANGAFRSRQDDTL